MKCFRDKIKALLFSMPQLTAQYTLMSIGEFDGFELGGRLLYVYHFVCRKSTVLFVLSITRYYVSYGNRGVNRSKTILQLFEK